MSLRMCAAGDYLCNLLQTAIECLLFFHPAVWWMSHRTRDLRELCCDEVAAQSCTHPVIYAEALLQLEEQRVATLQLATALHGSGGSLLTRIKQVLGESMSNDNKVSMSATRVTVAVAVIATLLLGPKVANGLKIATRTIHTSIHTTITRKQVVAPAPAPVPAPVIVPSPKPSPVVTASVDVLPEIHVNPSIEMNMSNLQVATHVDMQENHESGKDFLDGMRAAGYDLDLNKDLDTLINLRAVGVTPEYAKQMASLGYGKLDIHELQNLKAVGVTPRVCCRAKGARLCAEGPA